MLTISRKGGEGEKTDNEKNVRKLLQTQDFMNFGRNRFGSIFTR